MIANKVNYSLHTHTIGFDGQNSVEEMVNRAIQLGFSVLGFSNHFIVHPYIKQSRMYKYAETGGYANIYSETVDEVLARFIPHYQQVRALQFKYKNIKLLCGMEMDLFNYPGWADNVNHAVRILQPDYVIGARHFLEWTNNSVLNIHDIKNAPEQESGQLLRAYYQQFDYGFVDLIMHQIKFNISFFAHFNLPQKLGLNDDRMENYVLKRFSLMGIPIELNTSLIKNGNYPVSSRLKTFESISKTGVPVIISDDAHKVSQIGNHFDDILNLAQQSGITNICSDAGDLQNFIRINIQRKR